MKRFLTKNFVFTKHPRNRPPPPVYRDTEISKWVVRRPLRPDAVCLGPTLLSPRKPLVQLSICEYFPGKRIAPRLSRPKEKKVPLSQTVIETYFEKNPKACLPIQRKAIAKHKEMFTRKRHRSRARKALVF
eukprot:TRINITY_DN16200_c0_g1_i1.p1 TRINITY_DN16200_c0_g1~~TRINITY_DN16200_c0_g1_i1.p1  ORF type:complete len:131 (+),score=5.69 TRINITY_DN16200_c0_g1_i1:198-590(+)